MPYLAPHLNILSNLSDQTDYLENEKKSFRPEFYDALNTQFSAIKLLLLDEMTAILKEMPRAASATLQNPPVIDTPTESVHTSQMDDNALLELADSFNDDLCIVEDIAPLAASALPFTPNELDENILSQQEDISTQETESSFNETFEVPVTPMELQASASVAQPVPTPIAQNVSSADPKDVAKKLGERQWELPGSDVICQTQKIVVTRNGKDFPITLSISPLQVMHNGLVPIIVNAEYESFSIKQMTTLMSEPNEFLLQMDVDNYTFLISGSFADGVFSSKISSTGRSIEAGDSITVKETYLNSGTYPAAEIKIQDDATLWLSFNNNIFFGVLYAGEWIDEYNANHDVMIESGGDYNELRLTQNGSNWTLSY